MQKAKTAMKVLRDRIDELIRSQRLQWSRHGEDVEVELWRSGRRQRVHLEFSDGRYVFWSVVVGAAYVTRNDTHWRRLAYRVWRKNSSPSSPPTSAMARNSMRRTSWL